MKQYKVGYTTGVYDLFHVGHLNILKRAKAQCDYLIVGVSTDELVMEYKQKRPVIPFEERMEIIEGLKYVDQVVPQKNRDKYIAWEHFLFNVLFVGDDWKGDALFMKLEEKFKKVDVDVVYFPYTAGVSSTIVKEKIGM
ncbi:adenylyltransferase/cytidyltransferase family protein [Virgibacillus sp. W0181]|uniref:adenylyltransferase/cytidyltransferase family protein n=1 Tax=Virgibacillus sp. W0181 TaxID=3391581 RepID=UPI003F4697D7